MIGVDTTFLVQMEVRESALHDAARALLQREIIEADQLLGLVPQVLAEFIHVVTDSGRFEKPLSMPQAIERALFWWNAREVQQIHSNQQSVEMALNWMKEHQLGRKRILDTHLAATLWVHGCRRVATTNAGDFKRFGFQVLSP